MGPMKIAALAAATARRGGARRGAGGCRQEARLMAVWSPVAASSRPASPWWTRPSRRTHPHHGAQALLSGSRHREPAVRPALPRLRGAAVLIRPSRAGPNTAWRRARSSAVRCRACGTFRAGGATDRRSSIWSSSGTTHRVFANAARWVGPAIQMRFRNFPLDSGFAHPARRARPDDAPRNDSRVASAAATRQASPSRRSRHRPSRRFPPPLRPPT